MAEQRDLYEILELQKGASDEDIKKAYRKLAKKYQPRGQNGRGQNERGQRRL